MRVSTVRPTIKACVVMKGRQDEGNTTQPGGAWIEGCHPIGVLTKEHCQGMCTIHQGIQRCPVARGQRRTKEFLKGCHTCNQVLIMIIGPSEECPDFSKGITSSSHLNLAVTEMKHQLCLCLKILGIPIGKIWVGSTRIGSSAINNFPQGSSFEQEGHPCGPREIIGPCELLKVVRTHSGRHC